MASNQTATLALPPSSLKVVLAGNPNVGKSVFFNALTKKYVDVSNFPGTTVQLTCGRMGGQYLVDTPGIYGISSFNDEERVARDVILEADLVINVIDALHLSRDLFLTQQLIDLQLPVIVALNMMDEAAKEGLEIDIDLLTGLLGVPVIPTAAACGQGIDELQKAIAVALASPPPPPARIDPWLQSRIESAATRLSWRDALLYLEEDATALAAGEAPPRTASREEIYLHRRRRVNEIVLRVLNDTLEKKDFKQRLGHYMVRPLTGIPMLILALAGIYYLVGVFIAQTVVDFTEVVVMEGYYQPFIEALVGGLLNPAGTIGQFLIGEYGLLTMTVVYLLGLLMPLVFGFYLALSLLEDSGYLPRIATLVDRLLTGMGLNGRAVIPIILGFGCVTMATLTTRILGSRRERLIATVLLGITIPCSAQLGVIAGLIAPLGSGYLLAYLGTIVFIFVMLGTLMQRFVPGSSTDLLIDLPLLRLPQPRNVLKKTITKTVAFLKEAAPLFAVGSLIISAMHLSGILLSLQQLLTPLTVSWMKLPAEVSTVFVMGVIRRDFGAAGLYGINMSAPQVLVALVAITLFVPCIASLVVILKERGIRLGIMIWGCFFASAFLVSGLLAQLII